jgi:hypothetical protein
MALFMDRHDLVNATPEEMARAHICDLAVQDKYGVKFVTYWYHYGAGNGFCLVEAPTQEAAEAAHREAHGNLACQVIEVDWPTVEGFMGRIREPVRASPGKRSPSGRSFTRSWTRRQAWSIQATALSAELSRHEADTMSSTKRA